MSQESKMQIAQNILDRQAGHTLFSDQEYVRMWLVLGILGTLAILGNHLL